MARGGLKHKGGKGRRKKRELIPAFHILCEGVNTEPNYFRQFPIPNIGHCKGYGQTKIKLVETAIKYKRAQAINRFSNDQVWVVFDYDYDGRLQPRQKEDYNNAIEKANQNNIRHAVSNDSFELWYLLHYQVCNAQQLRTYYNQRIEHHTGINYDKNRETSNLMYDLLLPYQQQAIERASNLLSLYTEADKSHADKNPLTTVHKLVLELNKYINNSV